MGKVVFLGVEGSGKTTLAMALAKAFARHAGEGWYLRPEGRGAYNFATIAPGDFAVDGFPAQTSAAREMTWTISRDGADMGSMRILDYPGEIYRLAFLAAEDEPDPDAFRARAAANAEELGVLNRAIEEAESLYVLFNLQDALDLRGDDANRSAVWVTNECLKRLKALPSKPRVTLVFTQVDRYQTDDDFLHSFTPAELDLIGHDHPDVDWMMVSVLVPPDSEFGVDAFVRRVTGLGAFGVPDGRPRQRVASGGALARLADQRKSAPTGTTGVSPIAGAAAHHNGVAGVSPATGTTGVSPVVAEQPSRSGFLWLLLITVVVFALAYFAVQHSHGVRTLLRTLTRERSRLSRPNDAATTSAAAPVETTTNAAAPARAATNATVVATNVTPVVSAHMALSNETAVALAAARACATPQEAREILTYAAEGLNSAEAIYELARVDDLLGWGAFVRTREEKADNPPWTKWLRRIDLLGEKKAVFMQQPTTNSLACRTLALDGYRAAAARGVPAAVDALARHATHENDKDVRRSGKAPEAR